MEDMKRVLGDEELEALRQAVLAALDNVEKARAGLKAAIIIANEAMKRTISAKGIEKVRASLPIEEQTIEKATQEQEALAEAEAELRRTAKELIQAMGIGNRANATRAGGKRVNETEIDATTTAATTGAAAKRGVDR